MDGQRAARWAHVVAGLRGAVGAVFLIAPGFAVRSWLGPDADASSARVLARAVGARDLALSVATMAVLYRGEPGRWWLELGAFADGADGLLIGLAARAVPPGRRIAVALGAATVGGAGHAVARTLRA